MRRPSALSRWVRRTDAGAPGRAVFAVLIALPLALAAGSAGAAAPTPDPAERDRSAALAACLPNVELRAPDGGPLAPPLARGSRVLVYLRQDRTNVLTIRSGDLNRIAELIVGTSPIESAPLLVNVDTRLVDDRLTWAVPRVTGLGGGPVDSVVWHFPSAVRLVLTGPPAPGVVFAPYAEVFAAPSPSPSPSLSPSPSPAPSLSPAASPIVPPRSSGPAGKPSTAPGLPPVAARPAGLRTLLRGAPVLPDGLDCAPPPSASPSASAAAESPAAGPGGPAPGGTGSAEPSPKPAGERLMALASRPVTWFGVAGVLVGLALLISVIAGNRARRRFR
ncbi:choice-of-anchor A family protein [Catellatospora sp. NPDC049111]|uniref:choice-of-anchor A family protein n=1 Tax=Catellatospora sp. NPDC049111 TaxID=3155271 RepID=UPI0033C4AC5B